MRPGRNVDRSRTNTVMPARKWAERVPHAVTMKSTKLEVLVSPAAVAQTVSNAIEIHNPVTNHRSMIRAGELVVDLERRIVTANGKPMRLSGKEYSILELLSLRLGVTVTKEMLLGHLYGGKDEPELKIIDVFVCHLRKKLAQAM